MADEGNVEIAVDAEVEDVENGKEGDEAATDLSNR
jgi:hypothetical protein